SKKLKKHQETINIGPFAKVIGYESLYKSAQIG
uniref:Uncharacterized protein n=1 Tax=Ciona intestinalis TaxID=7719 RepID=H2XXP5_CIOIN